MKENQCDNMSMKKRSALGFDSDSSDEEIETKPKIVSTRKSKLPKLSFKTEEIKEKDIDEVRPTLRGSGDKDSTKDQDDYMVMVISENELTGPQSLRSKDDMKSQSQFNFENISDKKENKASTSLFGQPNAKNVDDTDGVMKSIPNSQLKSSSKGLSMMQKMGFKIGDTLGKDSQNKNALLEPILVMQREGRTGIKENEKVSKDNGKEASNEGMTNEDAENYIERLTNEQKEQRKEKILHKMQKYCWEFSGDEDVPDIEKIDPLGINVLWRGYVKYIQKLLKDKREQQRLKDPNGIEELDVDDDEDSEQDGDDYELELFEELSLDDKIDKLNVFLRSFYNFCYYCGVKYEDQKDLFENCPGLTEDEHI